MGVRCSQHKSKRQWGYFCHKTSAGLPIEEQSRRRFLWYEKFLNQAEIFYKISKTVCIPSIFSKLSLMSLTSSRS